MTLCYCKDAFSTRLGGGHDPSRTAHMVHHTPNLRCAFWGRDVLLQAWEFLGMFPFFWVAHMIWDRLHEKSHDLEQY